MTADQALATVKARKLKVANLYEGTDGIWRCFLRRRKGEQYCSQGTGKTAVAAITEALGLEEFEDLL